MLYQLPTHPGINSLDPLGILDKEDPTQAEVLAALFETALTTLSSGVSPKSLIPALIEDIAYTVHGDGSIDTGGLRNFLSEENTPPAPFVALLRAGQGLPSCFAAHSLRTLDETTNRLVFLGSQVNSLLAHQFLGTLAQPIGTDWGRPDFTSWFASKPAHYGAVNGYLSTIIGHFTDGGYSNADTFIFAFYNAADMPDPVKSSTYPRLDLEVVEEESEPSYDPATPFVLVAANAQPGPGPTATQEERLQAASPALCLTALVIPVIPDDAAVVTSAFPVHASWKGHNRTAHLETMFAPTERPRRHYIIADALPLDSMPDPENGLKDLVTANVEREVKKLYAAFSGASKTLLEQGSTDAAVVEAGPWGCGAFGGTFSVKMMCMQIASGLADTQLRLSITKNRQSDVARAHEFVGRQHTVEKLWQRLLDFRMHQDLYSPDG
jgi:hypothetical protein